MARHSEDREDLFVEAVALVPRLEWRSNSASTTPIVFGLRGRSLSIYVGSDLVDHFNAHGELRRAFRSGEMIKAEAGRLVGWRRERVEGRVEMNATDWSPERTCWELERCGERIERWVAELKSGSGTVSRWEGPAKVETVARMLEALAAISRPISIAQTPHCHAS